MTDTNLSTWVQRRINQGAELDGYAEHILAGIREYEAMIAEMEAALDSEHATVGYNIWRFWSDTARETATKNKHLAFERDVLRKAVEHIANHPYAHPANMMNVAREALEKTK